MTGMASATLGCRRAPRMVAYVAAVAAALPAGAASSASVDPGDLVVTNAFSNGNFMVYSGDPAEACDLEQTVGIGYPPAGVAFGPNGNLFVWQQNSGPLHEYDGSTGQYLGVKVRAGAGGTLQGRGIAFMPNGDILVAGGSTNRVARFDGEDGAYLGNFVPANEGGVSSPMGLTFGPNGNLFVGSGFTDQVLEYDGETGAFVGVFVAAGSGGLDYPYGVAFGPDDQLYVSARDEGEVYRFDGTTGDPLGSVIAFAVPPARGLAFSALGHLLVASWGGPAGGAAYEFDIQTGALLRACPAGGAIFVAVKPEDCNENGIPDEQDILDGSSPDFNGNGVPDECDPDCNENGFPDFLDLLFGQSDDNNGNGVPDECEVSGDVNQDGVVDVDDLILVIAMWGPCPDPPSPCSADTNFDGVVDVADLINVVADWD